MTCEEILFRRWFRSTSRYRKFMVPSFHWRITVNWPNDTRHSCLVWLFSFLRRSIKSTFNDSNDCVVSTLVSNSCATIESERWEMPARSAFLFPIWLYCVLFFTSFDWSTSTIEIYLLLLLMLSYCYYYYYLQMSNCWRRFTGNNDYYLIVK